MGLLTDDNEWHQALEEAGLWALGRQLHDMFASMLMFCQVTNPRQLWDAHWESLNDDIEATTRCEHDDPTVTLSEDAKKIVHCMRSIKFSSAKDTTWKIFQCFPNLIMSLLFMEETDWSKKSWLMISIY
jgi:hypothetical protein